MVSLNSPFDGTYLDVAKDDSPNGHELLESWCDEIWKEREKKGLLSGGVPLIQGDQIGYKKEGPGQYVIRKLFCKPSDPRACSGAVQVVDS
mgnify:CR=1 FL=1